MIGDYTYSAGVETSILSTALAQEGNKECANNELHLHREVESHGGGLVEDNEDGWVVYVNAKGTSVVKKGEGRTKKNIRGISR